MRKLTTNAVAMLLALVGCMGCGNRSASSVDNLIRVDVMADYPEKELILQDLMDVEYIALETTDDFITKGAVKAIGKDIMLVTNRGSDGEILVFDKNGKGLRKINRLGQSGEEYTSQGPRNKYLVKHQFSFFSFAANLYCLKYLIQVIYQTYAAYGERAFGFRTANHRKRQPFVPLVPMKAAEELHPAALAVVPCQPELYAE